MNAPLGSVVSYQSAGGWLYAIVRNHTTDNKLVLEPATACGTAVRGNGTAIVRGAAKVLLEPQIKEVK